MKKQITKEELNTLNYLCDLDINYILEDCEDIEEVREAVEQMIQEDEIIYYSNAMEFLKEEDPSLKESLELATLYGCEVQDINSELLATLLNQSRMMDEVEDLLKLLEDDNE
jgi:hypothetical protein